MANIKKWVEDSRNTDFDCLIGMLNKKLSDTNNYYSVSGAIREVIRPYTHAYWVVYKWFNCCSQRRSFTLEKFNKFWNKKIKKPYIHVNIWGVME